MYRIVTGVTSDVGVPSTYLVLNMDNDYVPRTTKLVRVHPYICQSVPHTVSAL